MSAESERRAAPSRTRSPRGIVSGKAAHEGLT